jgi:hypothetical protein
MWSLVLVYLETELVSVQDRCTVCAQRLKNHFGSTRWNCQGTLAMWNLVLVYLQIVPVLTQDWSTVCAERTIGLEIILDAPDGTAR